MSTLLSGCVFAGLAAVLLAGKSHHLAQITKFTRTFKTYWSSIAGACRRLCSHSWVTCAWNLQEWYSNSLTCRWELRAETQATQLASRWRGQLQERSNFEKLPWQYRATVKAGAIDIHLEGGDVDSTLPSGSPSPLMILDRCCYILHSLISWNHRSFYWERLVGRLWIVCFWVFVRVQFVGFWNLELPSHLL